MKKLQKADYIKMYSFMLKIRRFEERAAQLYGMGKIGGFCHLYIGQEAVVVGILMTIDKNDSVVTTYRDHGHMIARGLDPKRIMAELTGREDGYSAGKGGSMHMFSKENNFMVVMVLLELKCQLEQVLHSHINIMEKKIYAEHILVMER